jgi:hypothetical protein
MYIYSLGKRYITIPWRNAIKNYIGKRYCRLRSTLNPLPDFLTPYRPNTCFSLLYGAARPHLRGLCLSNRAAVTAYNLLADLLSSEQLYM